MNKSTKYLIEFEHHFCPDVSLDSPVVVFKLLEKLAEKVSEMKKIRNNESEKGETHGRK